MGRSLCALLTMTCIRTPCWHRAVFWKFDSDQLNIVFGNSRDTSDFVADCLELWWMNRRSAYPGVRRLLIDLDNGPEIASSRTQFDETPGRVLGPSTTDVGTGVLPALSQQIQPHRAVLGYSRKSLEWDTLDLHPDRVGLGQGWTMTWRGVALDCPFDGPRLRDRHPHLASRHFARDRRATGTIDFTAEMEPHNQSHMSVDYFLRSALVPS